MKLLISLLILTAGMSAQAQTSGAVELEKQISWLQGFTGAIRCQSETSCKSEKGAVITVENLAVSGSTIEHKIIKIAPNGNLDLKYLHTLFVQDLDQYVRSTKYGRYIDYVSQDKLDVFNMYDRKLSRQLAYSASSGANSIVVDAKLSANYDAGTTLEYSINLF